ncbi:hypothetical protein ACIQ9P_08205 [Kitasatospora sp. NPDC094019]|uniref:hypothetical protein n=1 Tax=Kitasatospora sp. NPDC094019 TaxID=3364091 RepID=UPI0038009BEB
MDQRREHRSAARRPVQRGVTRRKARRDTVTVHRTVSTLRNALSTAVRADSVLDTCA